MIFVSYSHHDNDWLDRLVTHLGVLDHQELLELWTDQRVEAGEDWYARIQSAIDAARIAVLLITPNFLSSPFIRREEIPKLLARREAEGLQIVPIVVKPCAWELVPSLRTMQLRPRDARPLSIGTESDIDQDLADVTREIYEILMGVNAQPGTTVVDDATRTRRPVVRGDGVVEKILSHPSSSIASVPEAASVAWEWFDALRSGEFQQAWSLSDYNWRLCRAQAWIWNNRQLLGLSDLRAAQEMAEHLAASAGKHPIWRQFERIERRQFLQHFSEGQTGGWGMGSGRRSVGPGYELFIFAPLGEHQQGFVVDKPTLMKVRRVLVHLTTNGWQAAAFGNDAPPQPGWPPAWWTPDPIAAAATDELFRNKPDTMD